MEGKTVDVAALDLLCDKLESGGANHRATAEQIRKAINGAKPQLPEGIEWPRFEDGELVKFGDEYVAYTGEVRCVEDVSFAHDATFVNGMSHDKPLKRPEPEVFDADGVPIKVGDTLYNDRGTAFRVDRLKSLGNTIKLTCIKECAEFSLDPVTLTHRKPDTRESVRAEIVEAVKADYAVNLLPLFDRYEAAVLRELGGE